MMFTPKVDTIHYDARVFTYSFPQLITKDTCKEFRNQFPHSNVSNVHAWHSRYDTHKQSNVFQPLIDTVLLMCYDISKEYYKVPVTDPYHYEVDDLWLSMYEKNDYTVMHDHFPATFAACYYVDVKEFNGLSEQKNKYSSSPITFESQPDDLDIQPVNGMLLIWMGMMKHKVEPTNKKRTCICMNIRLTKNE